MTILEVYIVWQARDSLCRPAGNRTRRPLYGRAEYLRAFRVVGYMGSQVLLAVLSKTVICESNE